MWRCVLWSSSKMRSVYLLWNVCKYHKAPYIRDMVVRTPNVHNFYLPFNGTIHIWSIVFIWQLLATNRLSVAGPGTAFPCSNIRIRYSWHTIPCRQANSWGVRRYGRSGVRKMKRLNIAKVLPFSFKLQENSLPNSLPNSSYILISVKFQRKSLWLKELSRKKETKWGCTDPANQVSMAGIFFF